MFPRVIIASREPPFRARIIYLSQFGEVIVRLTMPLLLLMLTLGSPMNSLTQTPAQMQRPHDPNAVPEDPDRQALDKEMLKKANQERQAQLRRDTDRLYQLSTQLKQQVDKSSENTLSLEVIKKAEEIEKLAHSVKEKMKGN
jgi:hypothetical protein